MKPPMHGAATTPTKRPIPDAPAAAEPRRGVPFFGSGTAEAGPAFPAPTTADVSARKETDAGARQRVSLHAWYSIRPEIAAGGREASHRTGTSIANVPS